MIFESIASGSTLREKPPLSLIFGNHGEEGVRSEERRQLREEVGCHRAAGLQAEVVEQHPPVRVQVEGRGSVLRHKEDVGEYVTATKFVNMAKEMAIKAPIYNGFTKATA
jgi:hypothetical protein